MCVISGGYWTNTSNAGVWALNLNNNRVNSNTNIGFRSADSDSASKPLPAQWSQRGVVSCSGLARRTLLASLLSGSDCERQQARALIVVALRDHQSALASVKPDEMGLFFILSIIAWLSPWALLMLFWLGFVILTIENDRPPA